MFLLERLYLKKQRGNPCAEPEVWCAASTCGAKNANAAFRMASDHTIDPTELHTEQSIMNTPPLHRVKSLSSLQQTELPCCACLRKLELSSAKPKKSLLKVKSLSESLANHNPPSTSNKHVGFDSVELREYPYVLGCNPSVKSGYPLALAWCPISDVTKSIDQFEEEHPPRHEMKAMSKMEREAFLLEAGYTKEELEKVYEEVLAIQLSREFNARDRNNILEVPNRPKDPIMQKYFDDSRRRRRDVKRFFSM